MLQLMKGVASTTAPISALTNTQISIFKDENPTLGQTTLTGSEPWNSKEEGFMWVRATPLDLSATSSNEFMMDLNDGSSNPAAGLRIVESSNQQSNRYRDDGGNLSSGTLNGYAVTEGAVRTFGFTWNNAQGTLSVIGGGETNQYAFTPGSFSSTGFTNLSIGSRNGGSEPFTGTIHAYEIGSGFLTDAALAGRMKYDGLMTILGAGQSLMGGHWKPQDGSTDHGYQQFTAVGSNATGEEIIAVNGSTGSSALSSRSIGDTNFWWDESTDEPGSAYNTWLLAGRNLNTEPDWCFWAQGEQDSFSIDNANEITRADYKTLLLKVFEKMRSDLNPNMKIGIQGIGRRAGGFSNPGGIQSIREVQQELADQYSWIHMLGYSYDVDLSTDNIHLTDTSYATVAQRLIRHAVHADGQSVTGSITGPQISGASHSGSTVTVSITHDGGSDFTPTSGIVGFRFFDDSTEISISSAVRTDANTVTLSLASTPSGSEALYYCYDDASDITNANLANVLKDNSAETLPLVPVKILLN